MQAVGHLPELVTAWSAFEIALSSKYVDPLIQKAQLS